MTTHVFTNQPILDVSIPGADAFIENANRTISRIRDALADNYTIIAERRTNPALVEEPE